MPMGNLSGVSAGAHTTLWSGSLQRSLSVPFREAASWWCLREAIQNECVSSTDSNSGISSYIGYLDRLK
jgi:hypothetical protein